MYHPKRGRNEHTTTPTAHPATIHGNQGRSAVVARSGQVGVGRMFAWAGGIDDRGDSNAPFTGGWAGRGTAASGSLGMLVLLVSGEESITQLVALSKTSAGIDSPRLVDRSAALSG
jgi:hypothetical protein